jgi:hypothetical protein
MGLIDCRSKEPFINHVMPAQERHPRMLLSGTGIQCLKSLDPGQKHAGMTIKRDGSGSAPFNPFEHFSLFIIHYSLFIIH